MLQRECLDVLTEVAGGLGYLTPLEPAEMPSPSALELVVAVNFKEWSSDGSSQRSGVVYLGLGLGLARTLAINMLGCPERAEIGEEVACEAALELANVFTGNILPVIYGADREFRLSSPRRAPYLVANGIQSAALLTEEGIVATMVHEG